MKPIYREIVSEGVTGVSDSCGDNDKGENLALIAGIEILKQITLFPEMLEMLKFLSDEMKDENPEAHGTIKAVDALIAKAGGE